MSKIHQAMHYLRLLDNYRDEFKRVTLSPALFFNSKEGIYENNNMLLFTGEAALLAKKQGLCLDSDFEDYVDAFKSCELMAGLYQRHPLPYPDVKGIERDVISHDEYNGVMYACAVFPEFRDTFAVDVCEYGIRNNWEYNDAYPDRNYSDELRNNFSETVDHTFNLISMISNKKDYRGKVGIAENLTQKRQLRDVCFYKIMSSKHSPSLLEKLYLAGSIVMSTKQEVGHKHNSGRMLALYRMWAIEEVGETSILLKLAHKYFRKKCKDQFGDNYVEELHKGYFKRDGDHPFHELCKGLK